jgi:Zn-dependent peptidase ImmA (M78 family)
MQSGWKKLFPNRRLRAIPMKTKTKSKILFFLSVLLLLVPFVYAQDNSIYHKGKISPYRILCKSESALYEANSVQKTIEYWRQGRISLQLGISGGQGEGASQKSNQYIVAAYHIKLKSTDWVKDFTDVKTEARVCYSFYGNVRDSRTYWVQEYKIKGVPFSWESEKKKWKNEALKIEDKRVKEAFSYSEIQNLAGVNVQMVDLASLEFVGEEKKNDKDCYLIKYKYTKDLFKYLGAVGMLEVRLWVEKDTFRPIIKRVEGNISGESILEVTSYQNYNASFDFKLPEFIYKETKTAREALKNKFEKIIEDVCQIRGWQRSEISDIKSEFVTRSQMKDALLAEMKEQYTDDRIEYEGEMLKWFNLIPKDADYRDIIFDSSDVAVIAGLYVPRKKTLFVGEYLDPAVSEIVCAHEIVHAFQDKKLNLQQLDEANKNNFDASMALHSFIEGEATAIMLEYLLQKHDEMLKDWDDIDYLIEQRVARNAAVRDKILYNVYGYGTRFIQDYLEQKQERGAWSWPGLNALYTTYPKTMEEVMYPEEYNVRLNVAGVNKSWNKTAQPLNISLPDSWNNVYSTRFGEHGVLAFLSTVFDNPKAQKGSSGWDNDKVAIYERNNGKEKIIVFLTKWDSPQDAQEFFDLYKEWLDKNKFKLDGRKEQDLIYFNSQTKEMTALRLVPNSDYVLILGSESLAKDDFGEVIANITAN